MAAERCGVWLMVSHTGGVGVMICCDFVCIRGMTGQDIKISRGMVQAFRAGLDTWAGHMGWTHGHWAGGH